MPLEEVSAVRFFVKCFSMSRILKDYILIPNNVSVVSDGCFVVISSGVNSVKIRVPFDVRVSDGKIIIQSEKFSVDVLSTYFVLIRNAISDVVKPFSVNIKMVGVGYSAAVVGDFLRISVGFSHNIFLAIPKGVVVSVKNDVEIFLSGNDRSVVSSFASLIRSFRKPEPYKGKGIFVNGEKVLRKEGKKK